MFLKPRAIVRSEAVAIMNACDDVQALFYNHFGSVSRHLPLQLSSISAEGLFAAYGQIGLYQPTGGQVVATLGNALHGGR